MKRHYSNVAQLNDFDEIVDVRSPSEYALDHIPGAVSCPVLSDEERAKIGTIHTQQSSFAAKKIGAALVARNIARHLEDAFADKPKQWHPLVYCWRGGQRSAAMASVLRQTGWDARQLEGGYKAFRRHVIAEIDVVTGKLPFRVICGHTGSGKSALLAALRDQKAQVLDLEGIAEHRGSVLGNLPGSAQPGQKKFESRLWSVLKEFDLSRLVYVEAESRKIGNLQLPASLMTAMRSAPCVLLQAGATARINLLLREYRHLTDRPADLLCRLGSLTWLHGRKRIERWNSLAACGRWETLINELLEIHYDPAYRKSTMSNYAQSSHAATLTVTEGNTDEFVALARRLIDRDRQDEVRSNLQRVA